MSQKMLNAPTERSRQDATKDNKSVNYKIIYGRAEMPQINPKAQRKTESVTLRGIGKEVVGFITVSFPFSRCILFFITQLYFILQMFLQWPVSLL